MVQRSIVIRFGAISIVLLLLAGGLLMVPVWRAMAGPPSQSPQEGEQVFQQMCTACHTLGKGDLVGPDLKGVTERRDRDWLARWIRAPEQMLAQKDPIATDLLKKYKNIPMPNMGLTETQVASVIAFLETQTTGAPLQPVPQAPAADQLPGDVRLGKNLFTGVTRFQNGGPPCMACHSIAGIGALGGGVLGPDLTGTYTKFGQQGTLSILQTFPFPTMNPVWRDRPLTPEEQASVLAFLQAASVSERPARSVGWLIGVGLGGAVLFLAVGQIMWRRRLGKVREPMVKRQGRGTS